jgi:CRP-like cAMP-binding protein
VEFLEGEVIMREGDRGDQLYLMIEGRVRVYLHYREPNERALNEQSAGTYFGEMAVLSGEERTATVVTSESCRMLSLDGNSLRELLSQMPEISFEIFKVLVARVRRAEQELSER